MEHHHQGDNYHLSDLKNSAVAINSAGAHQSVSVTTSSEERDLDQVLAKLAEIAERLKRELPSEKMEHFISDYEVFVKEVRSKAPRAQWYNISGEGLLEAARAVTTFPATVMKEYVDLAISFAKAKLT